MSKEKSIGFFPSERNNFIFTLLIILLVVLIIALFANLVYLGTKTSQDRGYVKSINNLRVYSQSIAANAAKALNGDKAGFSSLDNDHSRFVTDWGTLKANISPTDANSVDTAWQAFKPNIDILLSRRAALSTAFDTIKKSHNPIAKLREISRNTLIVLTQEQSDIRTITSMQEVALLIENIQHNLDNLLTDYSAIVATSASLTKQINSLKSVITRLQQKGALPARAQRLLQNATPLLAELNDNAINVDKVAKALENLQGVDGKIFSASQALLTASSDLAEKIEQATAKYSINAILNYVFGTLIILVIVAIAISIERNTRKRLQATATENSSNQEAILQLLDEIGDLADGDLTVNATVSEAFTGAIADSINYSIEQLRDLVETINHTSEQVSEAAETSQNVAMNLAEAAEHQAGEIAGVSDAIIEIARSIDQVSNTAKESEGVAQRSVEIAHNGNEVVHHAIAGMDTIREQIQDTAKRIKRLGESSQEIGNIVGLIDDIAEQTNILALNAAIQASMAGDAGRGFAVVADEVQRLAERSSSATKQIEMLVKTIQTDTNEAVISMEQTTSEVVRGAKLAENAGVALEEIENVSQVLAKLIQTISLAARQQASTASHVARTMSVVQEITYQTSSGSTEAAMIIGRLTTMARDMRTSVSGFKLPK